MLEVFGNNRDDEPRPIGDIGEIVRDLHLFLIGCAKSLDKIHFLSHFDNLQALIVCLKD